MKKQPYIFRFHNPNSLEITASFFLKTTVTANAKNIEEQILHNAISNEQIKSSKKSAFLSVSV